MSEFADMMAAGLQDSEEIMGSEGFSMDGLPYTGILNEFEGTQEVELGGILASYNATLVCQKPQFQGLPGPLHKTLKGKVIVIDGLKYSIGRVAVDRSSVTMGLMMSR